FSAIFSIPTYTILYDCGLTTAEIVSPDFAVTYSTDARLERITAAWLAALTVLLFYLIVQRRLPALWSLLLSLVYALATFHYTVSSQGLWQHGPAEFFILVAILFGDISIQRKKASLAFWCSLALACVFFTRPQNFFITGVLGLYYFWQLRKIARGRLWFLAGPIVPGLLYLLVNLSVYHHPLGGYAHMIHLYYEGPAEAFSGDFWDGLGGLLVSPGRGLFLYSPVLLLSMVGIWRGRYEPAVWIYTFIIAFQIILYSNYLLWWGGLTYGPRFLMETIPFFMLLLAFAFEPAGSDKKTDRNNAQTTVDSEGSAAVTNPETRFYVSLWFRQALLWSGLLSFLFQFAGIVNTAAFKRWNEFPHIDTFPDRVWDWSYPAFMAPLTPYRSLLTDTTRYSLAYYPTQGRIVRDARGMHGYLVEVNTAVTARIITAGLPVYLKTGDHRLRLHARLEHNRNLNIPLRVGVALSRNQKELGRTHVELQSTHGFTDTMIEIAVPEAGVYEISFIPDEYPGTLTVDYLEFQ
ncbi:MAG: hypothetical protein KDK27_08355, partial [Leptospiraceae bacterium]|nr:hypothetical protein [Leptospiraceae bacterium]